MASVEAAAGFGPSVYVAVGHFSLSSPSNILVDVYGPTGKTGTFGLTFRHGKTPALGAVNTGDVR